MESINCIEGINGENIYNPSYGFASGGGFDDNTGHGAGECMAYDMRYGYMCSQGSGFVDNTGHAWGIASSMNNGRDFEGFGKGNATGYGYGNGNG